MTDPVATLPGAPPQWPATVRNLLRDANEAPVDRDAALVALAGDDRPADGHDPSDDRPADRRLAFLEAADLVACEAGTCRPGASGREYLQTHDESVLFAALSDAASGFDGLVEALTVRPLTDVEAADLLSADREPDVDATTADRYLAWLSALGYVTREDGVSDLTRAGRRLVATTDRLTPPGGDASAGTGARSDDESPGAIRTCEGMLPDAAAEDGEGATDSGAGDAEVVVDADLERALRERYDDTCMLCGDRRRAGPDAGYAEVHFLMPRRDPHDGPAATENALVVCPNHRADLEHGTVTIDPQSGTVQHAYDSTVDGRTLHTVEGHSVGAQYLAYHNDVVAGN